MNTIIKIKKIFITKLITIQSDHLIKGQVYKNIYTNMCECIKYFILIL